MGTSPEAAVRLQPENNTRNGLAGIVRPVYTRRRDHPSGPVALGNPRAEVRMVTGECYRMVPRGSAHAPIPGHKPAQLFSLLVYLATGSR